MTATPALTSGLPVASPSSAAADAGMEEGDASFGDALDQVFLTTLAALKDGGPGRGKFLGDAAGEDADREVEGLRDAVQVPDRTGAANLVLATLQASGAVGAGVEGAAGAGAGDAAGSVPVTGPWMPGQVEDGESEFDAGQLLDALRPDAARVAGRDAAGEEFTENTTLRVLRRETHLAVVRTPVNVSATLGGLEEAARAAASETSQATPAIAQAPGNSVRPDPTDATPLGAVLARSHGDAGQTRRDGSNVQTDTGAIENAPKSGAASSFSFEEAAKHSADQNAGGDGRQGSRGEREASSQTSSPISIGLDGTRTQAVRDASGEVVYETPAEQIFSEVRAELDAEPALQTSTDGAKKVLHLELKPASLGSVTVRIALKDNVVTLHLEAQRSDTLAAIERDRDALAGALKSAGYSVDAITSSVQTDAGRLNGLVAAGADANSAAQGNPQGSFAQSAGDGAANSSSQGRSGQSMSENHGERAQSDRGGDRSRVSQGGSDGLYV